MKHILLIEDDLAIAELERDYLEADGFEITIETDGQKGLESALTENYDLLLVDVMLPGKDGFQIVREVRKKKDIPILMISAKREDIDKIRGLGLGADDYITKPFNNEVLVSRCNNLINSRRLLQHKFGEHPHTEANMLASNPLDKAMLDKAIDIIDKHYMSSDFSVEVFAREMGLSRTSLFTKWKTLTGQTPNEFIMQMRLRKAAKMLRENPQLSIAEISYKNGFSSPRYFCKCFKDRYQQQPSAYRNTSE